MPAGKQAALVTGAATRLGKAMALELARRGFAVAVHYNRSSHEAAATVAAIAAIGPPAVALQADLSDAGACDHLVPAARAALGPLHVLVNNAALFAPDQLATLTHAAFERQMRVNLAAPLWLSQAFVGQLDADADDAQIVNLIDQRVLRLTPNYTSYTLSKAALRTLTEHLAIQLAPRVRVNGIAPGLSLPAGDGDDAFARRVTATLLERPTPPDEIARALGYLLDARSVTGEILVLDSGLSLGWLSAKAADRTS
ncbi:MAG: SDR family oxidoreductase [Geminicoccaceae bacterium]